MFSSVASRVSHGDTVNPEVDSPERKVFMCFHVGHCGLFVTQYIFFHSKCLTEQTGRI